MALHRVSKLASLSLQLGWVLLRESFYGMPRQGPSALRKFTSRLEGWAEAASVRVVKTGAGHTASVRIDFLTWNMGRTLSAP